jgi:hypothetical protein
LAASEAGAASAKRCVIHAGYSEYIMLTTDFLEINQFSDETYWLNSQDSRAPHDCFGCAVEFESIDSRMTGFKPYRKQGVVSDLTKPFHALQVLESADHIAMQKAWDTP